MLKLLAACILIHLVYGHSKREIAGDGTLNQYEPQMASAFPSANRTFSVDYENDSFSMDGKPFRYMAGSLHYFRLPHQYWRDRLRKLRAGGLNVVSTYVEWSFHNPLPDVYNWEGDANLEEFIRLAIEEDLYVILRPGPYICAERDFGGQPWWLLSKYYDENPATRIKPRTSDERYMEESRKWLKVLLTKMSPYLYGNGGPIIMVQVENEYGSLGCDATYKNELAEIFKKYVQEKALLYTTDGWWGNLPKCGKIEGAYCTVDFGHSTNLEQAWAGQRAIEPRGPLVNSEFYPGWLTHWGEKNAHVDTSLVIRTFNGMLANPSTNINFYMFFGGTNFGFTNGANHDGKVYDPQITSYDYDAPLTEAGDPTEKYYAIRDTISQFITLPQLPVPTVAPKGDYGRVTLRPLLALLDKGHSLRTPELASKKPLTFEQMWQNSGFIIYHTTLKETKKAPLSVPELRDRALVYVNQVYVGVLDRHLNIYSLDLDARNGSTMEIIVENQGRINFGPITAEYKGLNAPVKWGNVELENWINAGVPLENGPRESHESGNLGLRATRGKLVNGPVLYTATFDLPEDAASPIRDTFLDMTGWDKGVAWINGHNLGRYWPSVGPQVTLYVPGVYLNHKGNKLEMFELQSTPQDLSVSFIKDPILNLPTKCKDSI